MSISFKPLALFSLLSLAISQPALAVVDESGNIMNIDLAPGLLTEVQSALPESTVVNQDFLNPSYDPNIILQTDAHVSVTFLDEGAGYRNALGYFTYTADTFKDLSFSSIDTNGSGRIGINELTNLSGVTTGMIFNNASELGGGGSLVAGDTVVLGGGSLFDINGTDYSMDGGITFAAGTNIGFFLLQNAWDGSQVRGVDTLAETMAFYTVDFLNPENIGTATIDNAGENSRHVAMMTTLSGDNEVILGFEDLVRPGGDNDFNDAVFRVRTDPVSALFADVPSTATVIALQAAPAPMLGQGISGVFALIIGGLFLLFNKRRESHELMHA